jgi:uncharacterized protein Usg
MLLFRERSSGTIPLPVRDPARRVLMVREQLMSSLALQLNNYRLTTAHIFYHMPDHPKFLQEYVWQDLDLAPKFPELKKFLDFWEHNLDGKLHSVTVGHCKLIQPAQFRAVQEQLFLH